jgi:hypothetical protein
MAAAGLAMAIVITPVGVGTADFDKIVVASTNAYDYHILALGTDVSDAGASSGISPSAYDYHLPAS